MEAFDELLNMSLTQPLAEYDTGSEHGEFKLEWDFLSENENSSNLPTTSGDRFAPLVTESELKSVIESQENINTKQNTRWAVNVFEKWRTGSSETIPELQFQGSEEMNYWLQRFIVEARGQDDAKMKSLIEKGIGCITKKADPILPEDEAKLWDVGVFGKKNAEQLQKTIFFYACKIFGLRGCDEHHNLECEQFTIGSDQLEKFIEFTGRETKTYKGGLGQLNVCNKTIKHHCQSGERCIADYFDPYLDSLGRQGTFYRRPLPATSEVLIRYGNQVVGINKLKNLMRIICTEGGLQGNYSNHSGKRTCATQLYMSGVEEQQIMDRTGHRSQAGVRKYKRSSAQMEANVSKILDPPKECTENSTPLNTLDECTPDISDECPVIPQTAANVQGEEEPQSKRFKPNRFPFGEFKNCNITFQF
ncbi:uncharacterized protein LOC133189188 [Saccostrea echinata]|uniref:uncharacterized protein LOC133189188 n=1 Tax=Saccostrea echinata TaxID=191078 RepID=UPI002A7F8B9F|nr:uncharacterized protein LOC133189188 [Saccostrea echinata]